ncbi:MAG: hypothetical protein ABIH70_04520 [Chloroflexota bacterium]
MVIKELQREVVANVRRWQKVENDSIASTGQIIQKTDNPLIRLAMEIIQRDSQMHYWVQGWIADTLESKTVTLSPDELAEVWDMIKKHVALEQKMIKDAEKVLAEVKGKRSMLVQQYFLSYLLDDEKKHSNMLKALESLTKGMRDSG